MLEDAAKKHRSDDAIRSLMLLKIERMNIFDKFGIEWGDNAATANVAER
jgi:hypothetical protein